MPSYTARGIYFFTGRVTCPYAGVGSRADDASNRLVLDAADTEVTIDPDNLRITVRDDKSYAKKKTTVADFKFLGIGYSASGEQVPFWVHLKVQKSGHKYSADLHRHPRSQTPMVRADYEPYTVTAIDGDKTVTLLDKKIADSLVNEPIALRLIRSLMAIKDHTAGITQDPAKVGYRVADLSVGVGALGVEYMMARASLVSLDPANAPLIERGSVPDMLREGAWELRLTAFSEKWLPDVIQRDLFLYGLEELPLLKEVRERGLKKNQTLAFRFAKGTGEVLLDNVSAPLPGALDVARAYLEFHMLGGLIAEHAESRSRRQPHVQADTRDPAQPARTR